MTKKLIAVFASLLALQVHAYAHRLDEYLQAIIIAVKKDQVQASMRLVPGIAVLPVVFAGIDANRDGIISKGEQQEYAQRVLRDLSLSIDGTSLSPRLLSADFPTVEEMKEGLGEIQIEFRADLPAGSSHRKLVIQDHHQTRISAYLVNCLVPRDPDIRVTRQNRNENQSFYELDYSQANGRLDLLSLRQWWPGTQVLFESSVGFASIFRLGIRHIAEGTDHLLFLLALLLPAPLMVVRSRWGDFAGVRRSLLQILRVVTAFTVGHSITLALAASGLVRVSSRPVEVLIALSILISAAHALRPLFPGREAVIAGFFGLIHGLAFAATLGQLGLGRWERVASVLAFNLGIETMQLLVVAATMPSLLLLSRTSGYFVLRIGGALFAGLAALGWVAERLLGVRTSVDVIVNSVAHQAGWIAVALFLAGVACRLSNNGFRTESTSRNPSLAPALNEFN